MFSIVFFLLLHWIEAVKFVMTIFWLYGERRNWSRRRSQNTFLSLHFETLFEYLIGVFWNFEVFSFFSLFRRFKFQNEKWNAFLSWKSREKIVWVSFSCWTFLVMNFKGWKSDRTIVVSVHVGLFWTHENLSILNCGVKSLVKWRSDSSNWKTIALCSFKWKFYFNFD